MVSLLNRVQILFSKDAKNVYLSLFLKVVTSILFLILVPFSIRTLGAEKYGIASFFLTMHGYVSLLDAGFTYALGLKYTRKLAHSFEKAQKILFSTIPIYLTLAVIAGVGFVLYQKNFSFWAFNTFKYSNEMALFGLVLAFSTVDSMFVAILQAHEKINIIAVGRFLLDLVKIVGLTCMAFWQMSPQSILVFIILSILVKISYDLIYFLKLIPRLQISFDKAEIQDTLKFAIPSVAIALCSLVISMLDKFLVSGKISSTAFAGYSFALDLTTKAYFLMYAVTSVVYPKLIKKHSLGNSSSKLLKVQLLAVGLVALTYYLPLAVFSSHITQLLLGLEYMSSTADLIKISCLSAVLYLLFTVIESYLNSVGSVWKTLLVYLIGVSSFVIILSYALPRYQVFGVAFSVVLMFLIMILAGLTLILGLRKL